MTRSPQVFTKSPCFAPQQRPTSGLVLRPGPKAPKTRTRARPAQAVVKRYGAVGLLRRPTQKVQEERRIAMTATLLEMTDAEMQFQRLCQRLVS